MPQYKKKFRIALGVLIGLIILLVISFLLKLNSSVAEAITRTFGRYFQVVFGTISSVFPFSLFEIMIIAIVIGVIVYLYFLIRHLRRMRLKFSSKYWLIPSYIIVIVALLYNSTAGIAYSRETLDIPTYEGEISDVNKDDYDDIANYFLNLYNESANALNFDENGGLINPYTFDELNEIMQQEFATLYSSYFTSFTPNVKKFSVLSWLYTEFHITGVTFAPLGEATVNSWMTAAELPYVMAHEIAHSKGVMREEDANQVAFYICLSSGDPYLIYSGLTWTFSSLYPFVLASGGVPLYREFLANIDEKIINDSKARSEFWSSYTLLSDVADWFNNLYLWISGNGGTGSYQDNTDTEETKKEDGTVTYTINSLSRYQKQYLYFYYSRVVPGI